MSARIEGRNAPLPHAVKEHLKTLVRELPPLSARNLAREYLQSRILSAMQNAGAMTSIAFQGGTCLRFLFNLPRYSEDLDFALEGDRNQYSLPRYLRAIRAALAKEGYRVELRVREHRSVHSGWVRIPGLLHELGLSPLAAEVLAVKIEIDTNPPQGAGVEVHLVRRHVTLRLFHHDQASLLSGKLHAVLQRAYAKGRDLYDLIWYLSDRQWPAPNLSMLNAALEQSGWQGKAMTKDGWRSAVRERVRLLDWHSAVNDVRPFLENPADAALVNKENALRLLA